jgi:hypothetical protein
VVIDVVNQLIGDFGSVQVSCQQPPRLERALAQWLDE